MKKILVPAVLFVAGLVIGIGLMIVIMMHGPMEVLRGQYRGVVEMNVVYATLLHDQKYADLNRLLETNIAASLSSTELMGFADDHQSSARLVRGYYDLTGAPAPAEVSPYLSGVKGANVRRLASVMASFSEKTQTASPRAGR